MASKKANKKVTTFTETPLMDKDIQNTDNKNESLGFMPPTDNEKKGEE